MAQDEYETGSDSETDINRAVNDIKKRSSPIKSSSSANSSFKSNIYSSDSLFNRSQPSSSSAYPLSGSVASDYASDRLNQIRSRLSLGTTTFEKPSYTSSFDKNDEDVVPQETPFLSNFTKRLSQLSSPKQDYDYKNDAIKENDTNGSGTFTRSYVNR